jgi:DNA (cytosine-5)-methyltransferase 1
MMLCGTMFGLRHEGFELRRHRLFESNVPMMGLQCHHELPSAPVFGHSAGRDFRALYGRDYNAADKAAIMGIDWMTRDEVSEAIPPVFGEYVGGLLLAAVGAAA